MLSRFNARRLMTSLIATVSVLAGVLTATSSVASAAVKSHAIPVTWTIVDNTNTGKWNLGDFITFDQSQQQLLTGNTEWFTCTSDTIDNPSLSSSCTTVFVYGSGYRINWQDGGKYLVAMVASYDAVSNTVTFSRSQYSPQLANFSTPTCLPGQPCGVTVTPTGWNTIRVAWTDVPLGGGTFNSVKINKVPNIGNSTVTTNVCTITDPTVKYCDITVPNSSSLSDYYDIVASITGAGRTQDGPITYFTGWYGTRPGIQMGVDTTSIGLWSTGAYSVGSFGAGWEFSAGGKTCGVEYEAVSGPQTVTGTGVCTGISQNGLGPIISGLTPNTTYNVTGYVSDVFTTTIVLPNSSGGYNGSYYYNMPINLSVKTLATRHAVPTNVVVTDNGDGTYNASWTDPAGATGSNISGYDNSDANIPYWGCMNITYSGLNASCQVQFLGPPSATKTTPTVFRVSAFFDDTSTSLVSLTQPTQSVSSYYGNVYPQQPGVFTGFVGIMASNWAQSDGLNSINSAPTPPDAPTGVTATAGNQSATISWTAPANTGSGAITGYTVTASPGGATCTTTTATSCTISGLTNGTGYTFSVVATNSAGDSTASDPSSSVTPAPSAPDAPTGVTATAGNGSATISWTAPANNGGSSITGYTVTASPGGATCTTTTATSCTISGLTNGTNYTFTVTATNSVDTSSSSASSSSIAPQASRPDAPTGASATTSGTSATISWTAPANNGGSAITGYTVTASPGGATCTTTSATSCTINGLTKGTNYTFSVTATNAAGTSSPSTSSASITVATTAPSAPTNVTATSGDGSATISWTAPADNGGVSIDGYIVTANPGGLTCTAVAPATTCTISGLDNGTTYTFTAVATNNVGNSTSSDPSGSVTPASGPAAPDHVQVTPGNGTATINWTAPTSGPAPTSYTVTVNPDGHTCTVDLSLHPLAALSCTFTGLDNGVNYTFTVTSSTGSGATASDTVVALVQPNPTKPSTPRGITFRGTTTGVATLTWLVSGSNGGSAITRYIARVTGPHFAKTCSVNVAANANAPLTCSVSGLKPRTNYTYTVIAVNSVGSNKPRLAKRAIDTNIRIATFARGKTTMWSGLYRQAYITAFYIKKFKFTKVTITGYSNFGGSHATTLAYTQARALTVANYLNRVLASMHVSGVTVTAVGNGSRLVGRNSKLNRSVTALLSYK